MLTEEHKRKISIGLRNSKKKIGAPKGGVPWSKLHPELCKANKGSFKSGNKKPDGAFKFESGVNHLLYKDGMSVSAQGYVFMNNPTHPFPARGHYVLRSRLVMEHTLGRYLRKEEVVHHINGNKLDDTPDNLEIVDTHSHTRVHMLGNSHRKGWAWLERKDHRQ